MRIHRALARAGITSRRKAEELVQAGRVAVNGRPATIGQTVDPAGDRVTVDGRPIDVTLPEATWMVLHKPSGYVTTRSDPQRRRTVFDLVNDTPGLAYVGRLDLDTEGVLLLTTDGSAANALTHPSNEVERVYVATVTGNAPDAARRAPLGVSLGDGVARARWAKARRLDGERWALELALTEGRKREVRRLCRALGLRLERLVRTRFGPVTLGALPPGASRALTGAERRAIDAIVRGERPNRRVNQTEARVPRKPRRRAGYDGR